jgi:hypothetical protein
MRTLGISAIALAAALATLSVCVVTRGNITELIAATAVAARLPDLLSVRMIGYTGKLCSGGEAGGKTDEETCPEYTVLCSAS